MVGERAVKGHDTVESQRAGDINGHHSSGCVDSVIKRENPHPPGHGQGYDAGGFITVQGTHTGGQRFKTIVVRLGDEGDLFGTAKLSLPRVYRADRGHDVHAGRKAAFHQIPGDAFRLVRRSRRHVDEKRHIPSLHSALGRNDSRFVPFWQSSRPAPSTGLF